MSDYVSVRAILYEPQRGRTNIAGIDRKVVLSK